MWRWILLGLALGSLAVVGVFYWRSRHTVEQSEPEPSHTWLKLA